MAGVRNARPSASTNSTCFSPMARATSIHSSGPATINAVAAASANTPSEAITVAEEKMRKTVEGEP